MNKKIVPWLLIFACALPFLAGVNGPFFLDDEFNLQRARAPSGDLVDFADALLRNNTGLLRRPISNASFLVNYHWLGSQPAAYKWVNIAIHLLNAVLVWRLCLLLLAWLKPQQLVESRRLIAIFVACIWAIHPLQVSTVLYSVQRMTQLSALFVFLSAIVAIRAFNRLGGPTSGIHSRAAPWASGALVLMLFVFALLSKENGAVAPLMLGVALLFYPQALNPQQRLLGRLTVSMPIIAGLLGACYLAPGVVNAYDQRDFTLVERLLTEPYILLEYLRNILLPNINNMGLYLDGVQVHTANEVGAWALLATLIVVVAAALILRKRFPLCAFATLWFAAAHSIESTIMPLELAFEHRNYVAMLGPILALGGGLTRLAAPIPLRTLALIMLGVGLALSGSTLRRAHTWSNSEIFAQREVANHPKSVRALAHAASIAYQRGELETGSAYLRQVIDEHPDNLWAQSYRINLLCFEAIDAGDEQILDHLLSVLALDRTQSGNVEVPRTIAKILISGDCPQLRAKSLDRFINRALVLVSGEVDPIVEERLLILRATIAEQEDSASTLVDGLLLQAIARNPQGTEALTRMAYKHLNRGETAAASRLADQIEQRIKEHGRATELFEVAELRSFISEESDSRGLTPTTTAESQ